MSTKRRALDLFGGAGGTAEGLLQAGFTEVVGLDHDYKGAKHYPGIFIKADVFDQDIVSLDDFDFVWASPPCQRFCRGIHSQKQKEKHPDLIKQTRELLAGHPFTCIENIPDAPIRADLVLYGPMVGLERIERRRHFEMSFFLLQPPIVKPHPAQWKRGEMVSVTSSMCASGHYKARKEAGLPGRVPMVEAREVMGVKSKMNAQQLANAVPPPMAKLIGEYALARMKYS